MTMNSPSNITRIRYFTRKANAVQNLKSMGFQPDPDLPGNWFRYPIPGAASKTAAVVKHNGLWEARLYNI